MRRLLNLIIVIVIAIIIYPKNVAAIDNTFIVECDKNEVVIKNNAKCSLYADSEYHVAALEFDIVNSEGLKVSEYTLDDSWQGDVVEYNAQLYTDINKINKFKLLDFEVTSDEVGSYTITIENAKFTNESFVRNDVYGTTYTISFVDEKKDDEIIPDGDKKDKSEDEENPKTGNILPIALIGGLLVIGVGVLIKTRKIKIFKL